MSVPFQGERLGLGLYPGVYMGMAPPILLGSKFGQILFFFLGRGVENWRYFLGYVKLRPLFAIRQCNKYVNQEIYSGS